MRQADFRCKAIRDNAAEIAFYPAPCDMSHAVEIFLAEQFYNRFVIGRVGLHNLFDKCQAVYPIQFYLRHFFHKEPDKRIAVGMQTIGSHSKHGIPFINGGTVDDVAFFYDPGNAGGQYVDTCIDDQRLYGGLTSHKRAFVVPAGLGNSFYQCFDGILFCISADDGVQNGQRPGTHDHNIVHQMIDHVVAD